MKANNYTAVIDGIIMEVVGDISITGIISTPGWFWVASYKMTEDGNITFICKSSMYSREHPNVMGIAEYFSKNSIEPTVFKNPSTGAELAVHLSTWMGAYPDDYVEFYIEDYLESFLKESSKMVPYQEHRFHIHGGSVEYPQLEQYVPNATNITEADGAVISLLELHRDEPEFIQSYKTYSQETLISTPTPSPLKLAWQYSYQHEYYADILRADGVYARLWVDKRPRGTDLWVAAASINRSEMEESVQCWLVINQETSEEAQHAAERWAETNGFHGSETDEQGNLIVIPRWEIASDVPVSIRIWEAKFDASFLVPMGNIPDGLTPEAVTTVWVSEPTEAQAIQTAKDVLGYPPENTSLISISEKQLPNE